MKEKLTLYFMLFLLIMMPVLDISGHFINLAEFYLYIAFFLNLKKIRKTLVAVPFMTYTILFFVSVLLTSVLAGEVLNNYDIFVLRNMAQLVMGLVLFYSILQHFREKNNEEEQYKTILWCFGILSLPALIVFLQSLNMFGMRSLVQLLYKPQFFFLKAEDFSGFRYTSVFKDFFTSAVYYVILSGSIFYFYLKAKAEPLRKLPLLLMLLVNFAAQFFVSRTSLVGIPVMLILMLMFGPKESIFMKMRRIFITMILVLPLLGFLSYVLINTGAVNVSWAMEAFELFSGDSEMASTSFAVMNMWMMNFYNHLADNPELLLKPKHVYDLTESANPFLYSDSFYPQEIYRYGVYGILSYLFFVITMIRFSSGRSKGLMLLTIALVVLNYKGGNTFFMPRNIYMYAFVFAFLAQCDGQLQLKAQEQKA